MTEVSREQAWMEFQSTMPDNLKNLMKLDFNPLPASLKIRFAEIDGRFNHIQEFANKLKKQKGIESLEYGKDWIARFEKLLLYNKTYRMY